MEFIGKYKEFNKSKDFPSIKDSFSDAPYEGKQKIIYFLKHGKEDLVSMELPRDVITNEPIPMEKVRMNDGKYTWFNTLAYYVDKYNLRFDKEIEDYILSK